MPSQGPSGYQDGNHRQGIFAPDPRFWQAQPPPFINQPDHINRYPQYQPGQMNPGYRGNHWTYNPHQHHDNFPRYNYHHHNHNNNNSSHVRHVTQQNHSHRSSTPVPSDTCCVCRDMLQNCEQIGIHLCDGGDKITDDKAEDSSCRLSSALDKMLVDIKSHVRDSQVSIEEALSQVLSERIGAIEDIHDSLHRDKEVLEQLLSVMHDKIKSLEERESKLKCKEGDLLSNQRNFKDEIIKEREEICRQWQLLRDEISRMEEIHKIQKGRVRLDVGGTMYTTSLLTLRQDPDSMLAAMFSGRHALKYEEDGSIFIDRDGQHFRYILNYLRDGCLKGENLPRNRQILRELRNEAIYFQLHGMLREIEKLLS